MKITKKILRIALPTPLRRLFDYSLPNNLADENLHPGMRVKVSFGRRKLIGVLVEVSDKTDVPTNKLKSILEIIDQEPVFTNEILDLCRWASDYYHHPIGEVLFYALPTKLRQGKPAELKIKKPKETPEEKTTPIKLNDEQKNAVEKILKRQHSFQCFLLHGVTGSGKTEVYLQVIQKILDEGKQALILVPEIALTPQTINRFQERFNETIACMHSGLNPTERLNAWIMAKSGEAKIIIGTRSAIFTPCKNLGIIILDEEHDLSFKQQDGFRYSARSLATIRAKKNNIPIVLGSATPSLETLYNVLNKNFQTLSLPERVGSAIHPSFKMIDICNQNLDHGLSKALLERIEQHLNNDSQVLLFLNRRGYAPTLMCHQCGWIAQCPRCDVHFTLHNQPEHLHCHHCDTKRSKPAACPECGKKQLQNIGVGTERLEKALGTHFPDIQITRIDRDTTRRKNSIEKLLKTVHEGKKQILIGTQMIAKGHHFPNVTLVGIINADAGFFSADFRATERAGQLLLQVSGRAGRAEKPGEVYIQTHYANHPLLVQLTQHGYLEFAKFALKDRQESELPPYSHFALVRAFALDNEKPMRFLENIKSLAEETAQEKIKLLGPIPAPMPRRKSHFQSQLLFQSRDRAALQKLLKEILPQIEKLKSISQIKWNVDVDPMEMY